MNSVALGAAGALRIGEKFNIEAFMCADCCDVHFENTCFAIADDKGRVARLDSDYAVQKFKRTFGGATYKLACDSVPAKVTVTAITPQQNDATTPIPAVLFRFKIKNKSNKNRTFYFGALAENCSEDSLHEIVQNNTFGGVMLGPATKLSVQSGYLTQCIALEGEVEVAGYVEKNSSYEVFCEMLRRGTTKVAECAFPTERACAAVIRKLEIPAGESVAVNAVYAWHEPNLKFMNDAGETMCFKSGYTADFDSSKTVAAYVLENAKSIVSKVELLSSDLKKALRGFVSVDDYLKNLEFVYSSSPVRLNENGNGKMFYINPYSTPFFYAKPRDCNLGFIFDSDMYHTDKVLDWQLQNCVSKDGSVSDLPRLDGNVMNFECENKADFKKQLALIFHAYRHSAFIDEKISAYIWQSLTRMWKYLQAALGVDELSYLVHDSEGICDIYKTCMYILAAICMVKLANRAEEYTFAETYDRVLSCGLDFIKNHAFNGKFYSEYYPQACNKQESCSLKQIIPFVIAKSLGISLADDYQVVNALESIYVNNYSDEGFKQCGMKLYSDGDEIDSDVEELYMLGLMQFKKLSLVSLIQKARHKRDATLEYRYLIPLVEAQSESNYFRGFQHLQLGTDSAVLFRGDSLILIESGKLFTVRVLGAPIRICCVSGLSDKVKKVNIGDTEYMFSQTGDTIHMNSVIDLREGDTLIISINK